MVEYRACIVGTDGHFASCRAFRCADDSEAVIWARQLVDGHDVELWSGDRFIIKLERHTVVYEAHGRVYAPEELMLFRRVFEKALTSLPEAMRTDGCRSRLAQNLLACAATGERDPVELRIAALADLQAAAA